MRFLSSALISTADQCPCCFSVQIFVCSTRLFFLQKERRSYFEDLRLNLEMRKPKYDSTVNPHKDSLTKKKKTINWMCSRCDDALPCYKRMCLN